MTKNIGWTAPYINELSAPRVVAFIFLKLESCTLSTRGMNEQARNKTAARLSVVGGNGREKTTGTLETETNVERLQ